MESKKSKDFNVKNAAEEILKITTVEGLKAFISEDEDRSTVLNAAAIREKAIADPATESANKPSTPTVGKQGEQNGPITQPTADFKDGLQATKAAFAPQPPTLPKAPTVGPYQGVEKAEVKTKTYVTGEDVIARMRKEGKNI